MKKEIFYSIEKPKQVKVKAYVYISILLKRRDEKYFIKTYEAKDSDECMYYLKINRNKGYQIILWAIGISKKDAERLLSHKASDKNLPIKL